MLWVRMVILWILGVYDKEEIRFSFKWEYVLGSSSFMSQYFRVDEKRLMKYIDSVPTFAVRSRRDVIGGWIRWEY